MIMTLHTAHGESQERATGGVYHVDVEVVELADVASFISADPCGGKESSGDDVLVAIVGQLVAGELFGKELVVGFVCIESADDVEPVACPAFAILAGGEHALYQAGVGVGGFIGDEGRRFLARGGESAQRQRKAANQDTPGSLPGRSQVALEPRSVDEVIDGMRVSVDA